MPMTQNPEPVNLDELLSSELADLSEREISIKNYNQQMKDLITLGPPAAAIGAIDTIAQSLTPDSWINEETVGNYIQNLNEPLGKYYLENREAAQTVGEIGSAFVPIVGATKLIRSGSYVDKAMDAMKLQKFKPWVISSGRSRKDFIDSIDQEAKVFVDNKQLSLNENGNQPLFKALQNAKVGAAGDMLKESIAADLAIVSLYNESDMFFPDDLSAMTNFALFAIPDVALTGLAYRFTGTAIKKHLQASFGTDLAKSLNPDDLPVTKSVSFPGMRGPDAALQGYKANKARADMVEGGNSELKTSGNQRLQSAKSSLMEQIILMGEDDVFKHGITHPFKMEKGSPEAQNLLHSFEVDPSLAVSLRSVEELQPDSQIAFPKNLQKRLDNLVEERKALQKDLRLAKEGVVVEKLDAKRTRLTEIKTELDQLGQLHYIVAEVDGSITPLAQRKYSILDEPEKLADKTLTFKEAEETIYTYNRGTLNDLNMEVGVTKHGKVLISSTDDTLLKRISEQKNKVVSDFRKETKDFKLLSGQNFDQRMHTWGLMQKALDSYNPAIDGPVVIHPNSNFMELDFAYQVARQFPDSNAVKVASGGERHNVSLDNLQFQLAAAKFREYQKLRNVQNANKVGILKLPEDQLLSDYDLARMLNLPNPTAGGKHPMLEVFDEYTPLLGDEIRDLRTFFVDFADFKGVIAKHTNPAKLGEPMHADLKLTGNSLLANNPIDRAPSILLSTNDFTGRLGPEELTTRILGNKLWQNEQLAAMMALPPEQRSANLVASFAEELFKRKDAMEVATRPDYIFEGSAINKGIAGQQSQVALDNSVIQSMDRLIDLANKRALSITNEIFAGPNKQYTATFNRLLTANNAASLDTFNIAINSLHHGWKVKPKPVQLDKGLFGFVLDNTWEFNKTQYEKLFGISFDEVFKANGKVLMPVRASVKAGSGEVPTAVAVDELALQGMTAITAISHTFLDNLNFLRSLRHQPPISKKAWHIPSINVRSGHNIYLSDGTGRVHDIVNRATFGEAVRVAEKEIAAKAKEGVHWIMQSEKDVHKYFDTLGDVWSNPRNFAYSEFQTGTSKGKLGTRTIEFGKQQLNTLIENLRANYQLLTRHSAATIFESELNYTKSFIQANTLEDPAKRAAKSTLHQKYQDTVLQRTALNPNGYVGKFYYAVESVADDFFRAAWDKVHAVKQPTAQSVETEFGRLENKLGSYNPFKSTMEMLEANESVRVPPTFRGITSKLNGFTTDMVLRILDMGMPIINFASLASVTPAVVSALRRGPNENYDAWAARISAIGTPIDADQAIPSTTRMVMEGIHAFFDPETQVIRKMAAERGYIKQEVAERLNLWTSQQQGWLGRNRDKLIEKLSWPTDHSETMSRDIAFQMMYRIGRKTFGLDTEAAMLFAHSHANKVIGDFRPTNRPQMFQGAAGMPLGLFTTWAINWLQRVFGDIEAGRMGAVFWQGAMQQFLFGAQSFPGVNTFIENFMTSYDGKTNVIDAMDARFGKTASDAFFQGTLASLTGVAFQSRAGVSLPSIWTGESPITAVPSLSVMSTLYQGLSEGFKSIRQNHGLNVREMSELISVYGVNGFLRNTFQVLNNAAVDRHGALINADIRSFESMVPRLMELKSVTETRKAAELQRDRMQRQIKREHLDRLSKQLRAAVRGGSVDAGLIESSLMDYYKAGGSPEDFKRYLREQILTASFERSSRVLLAALRQSDEQGKAMRLMRLHMEDGD